MASQGSRSPAQHVLVVQVAVDERGVARRIRDSSRCSPAARETIRRGSASRRAASSSQPAAQCSAASQRRGRRHVQPGQQAADDLAGAVGVDGAGGRPRGRAARAGASRRWAGRRRGAPRRRRPRCAGRAARRRCRCCAGSPSGPAARRRARTGATTAVQPVRSGPSATRPHRSNASPSRRCARPCPLGAASGRPRRAAVRSRSSQSAGMTGTAARAHVEPRERVEVDAPAVRLDLDGAQPAGQGGQPGAAVGRRRSAEVLAVGGAQRGERRAGQPRRGRARRRPGTAAGARASRRAGAAGQLVGAQVAQGRRGWRRTRARCLPGGARADDLEEVDRGRRRGRPGRSTGSPPTGSRGTVGGRPGEERSPRHTAGRAATRWWRAGPPPPRRSVAAAGRGRRPRPPARAARPSPEAVRGLGDAEPWRAAGRWPEGVAAWRRGRRPAPASAQQRGAQHGVLATVQGREVGGEGAGHRGGQLGEGGGVAGQGDQLGLGGDRRAGRHQRDARGVVLEPDAAAGGGQDAPPATPATTVRRATPGRAPSVMRASSHAVRARSDLSYSGGRRLTRRPTNCREGGSA